MIKIKIFVFSYFAENTYLVFDEVTKEALVIDAGCFNDDEKKELEDYIVKNELKLKYMVTTHCHIDHVIGNEFVKSRFNPVYYAPEEDQKLYNIVPEQARQFGLGDVEKGPEPDSFITEDTVLSIGQINFRFLFTPGHSPGEYCVLFEKEKICFSGDVLFKQSIGRTDLWDGDSDTLINSIKNKLFVLDDDTTVFPGHGENTTIGYEKYGNPYVSN